MKEIELPITVRPSDIYHIGGTMQADENGNVSIIIDHDDNYSLSIIMLRSILRCYGEQYRIVNTEDFWWNEEQEIPSICVTTNLPNELAEQYYLQYVYEFSRFILQQSQDSGWWIATDKEYQIVIKFQEHQFNDTQVVTSLKEHCEATPQQLATAMRELADWLRENHSDKIF